ncbi:uncharacterized protein LOC131884112 [Tigriopus californicus]|uniref:uncharacterized protein LOC131884112 n=1 Tax=Tigriopus californicus TaxID=6832 RepID=UPI0027DA6A4C|nr:uncharacterized protein LOC131884112 [Tigriopus californicus]
MSRKKRMDETCFDLTRIDGFYRRKHEYIKLGIKGAHKPSRMQKNFEALHPEDENFIVTNNEVGFVVLSVRSNVEYEVKPNEMGCVQKNCLVRCSRCANPKACGHSFVCSCMQYSLRNVCPHCHVVAKWVGLHMSETSDAIPDKATEVKNILGLPVILPVIHGVNTSSEANSDILTKVTTSEVNLVVPTETTSLEVESKLNSKNLDQSRRYGKALEIVSEWKRSLESAESFEDALPLIEKIERSNHDRKSNIFPLLDRKRKRERTSSIFPARKLVNGNRGSGGTASLRNSPIQDMIIECSAVQIDDPCWMFLVTHRMKDVIYNLGKTTGIDQKIFLKKYETARLIWNCALCKDVSVIARNLSGYVQCDICDKWFHCECVGVKHEKLEEEKDSPWFCSNHSP